MFVAVKFSSSNGYVIRVLRCSAHIGKGVCYDRALGVRGDVFTLTAHQPQRCTSRKWNR